MNGKKSVFITLYGIILLLIGIDSLISIYSSQFALAWLGPLIAFVAVTVYFIRIQFFPIPRTRRYITPVLFFIMIGAAFSIFDNLDAHHSHSAALAYLIVIFTGWLFYEFWYSNIIPPQLAIDFGSSLPNFSLYDKDGRLFRSREHENIPLLLVFYRGNWSSFCIAYLKELAAQYQEIADHNIKLLLISPQPAERTRLLADKLNIPATFLVDQHNKLADEMGIAAPRSTPIGIELFGYDTDGVIPAVILTNAQHDIIYKYIPRSHRLRPTLDTILHTYRQTTSEGIALS